MRRLYSIQFLCAATIFACTTLIPIEVYAADFPAADWVEKPHSAANVNAPKGGQIVLNGGSPPKSLNYYLENSTSSAMFCSLLFESLLSTDPDTADHAPGLADRWSVSDDGLVFTFHIDPRAKWSDGKPVLAEDVRWTFAELVAPTNMTGPVKVSLSVFSQPEVLDERTIRFTASEAHWRNLSAIGGIFILPAHEFKGRDFNRLNFDFPVVSGPYKLKTFRENISMSLERREDWWGAGLQRNAGLYNFDTLEFRFSSSQENAFDAFKKGALDVYPVFTASIWVNETRGEKFDKNWIIRKSISNQKPVGFQGFALNMRRAPLNDVNVRRALAMLLDREGFNKALMYGQYFMHRSYWEDLYDAEHPCKNRYFAYNPTEAYKLLAESGWKKNPKTGLLEKDGKEFVLEFLANSPTSDKFLARYRVDLEKAGIKLKVERKDWAGWARDMDSFNFSATWCAWSSGIQKDPEDMWSSAQAQAEGGNNITGFMNKHVDELIAKQRTEYSLEKRNAIDREIDEIITSEVPYILLWNCRETRLLWWNKFGVPPSVISRYGGSDDAIYLWWSDPDAEEALNDAKRNGAPLNGI